MDPNIRLAGNVGQVIGGTLGVVAGPVGMLAGAKAGEALGKALKTKMQTQMNIGKKETQSKREVESKSIANLFSSFKATASKIEDSVVKSAIFRSFTKACAKGSKVSTKEATLTKPTTTVGIEKKIILSEKKEASWQHAIKNSNLNEVALPTLAKSRENKELENTTDLKPSTQAENNSKSTLTLDKGKEKCQQYEKTAVALQKNIQSESNKFVGEARQSEITRVFAARLKGAGAISIPIENEINTSLLGDKGRTYINHLDSGAVSHGNICVENKRIGEPKVEGEQDEIKQAFCFDLKLNMHAREKLTHDVAFIEENLSTFEEHVKKASALKGVASVTISTQEYVFRNKDETGIYRNKKNITNENKGGTTSSQNNTSGSLERNSKKEGAYVHINITRGLMPPQGSLLSLVDKKSIKSPDSNPIPPNNAPLSDPHKLAQVINFEGVGKVILMRDPNVKSLYQDVSIEIEDKHANPAQAAQEMLALLGIGPALCPQANSDKERLKLAIVFREHFPTQAVQIESNPAFYELPVDELREQIEAQFPQAKGIFKDYLDQPDMLVEVSTFGRIELGLSDMDQKMREAGAVGLMIGVTGYGEGTDIARAARALGNMLTAGDDKSGIKSSVERMREGTIIIGDSTPQDMDYGGAKGSFARVVHKNNLDKGIKDSYALAGAVAIKLPLEAAKVGCHLNLEDAYGINYKTHSMPQTTKLIGELALATKEAGIKRNALQERVDNINIEIETINQKASLSAKDQAKKERLTEERGKIFAEMRSLPKPEASLVKNELSRKGGFPSTDFAGFVVSTKDDYNELLALLKEDFNARLGDKDKLGSVSKDDKGNFFINDMPLEDFIEVATTFSEEGFEKKK